MAYLIKQGGKADYNYKEFVCDTTEELANIAKQNVCPGSIAYIIETGDIYILNQKKEWEVQ